MLLHENMEQYNKYLSIVEKEFGHKNTTNNHELDKYCRAVFGEKFRGAFAKDRIPTLKNRECAIFNLDDHDEAGSHWMGLFKSGKKHIIYDSFGRSSKELEVPVKSYIDTQKDAEQRVDESNCGQRVISFLACCYTMPLSKVLTI